MLRTALDLLLAAALCAWFVSLQGCATVEPRVSTITHTVSVPVPIPCLAASDVPLVPPPTAIDVERAGTDQLIAAMARDLLLADEYFVIANSLLRQCAGPL